MLAVQAALGSMIPSGAGRIITVYGNLGDRGVPNLSAFAASKAAVARLTETLGAELAGTGVVALCLHPGFVRTPMTERLAWGDEGRRWVPGFGERAEADWGDGESAIQAVEQILAGKADALSGRVIYAGEGFDRLAQHSEGNPDLRRLRINVV